MDMLTAFASQTHLPVETIAVRLLVAATLGAVIGIEREWRHRPAGLRTHMLTALAAAVFTLLTAEILHSDMLAGGNTQSDPVRIIEAVTGGVAFLAAGAIIRNAEGVRGLTTGAGMWLAGAIGVATGLGQFSIAAMATVLGFIVIALLRYLEVASVKQPSRD